MRVARCKLRWSFSITLAFVAVFVLLCRGADAASRSKVILTDNWHIRQLDSDQVDIAALAREAMRGDGDWLSATMPAQVHDVLLAHGKISDPHIGKNAAESAWVGEKDWAYACRFTSPTFNDGGVLLHFDGLDTLAKAYLNGRFIGAFDNMYRRHVVDVADRLAPAGSDNMLLIVFSSPLQYLREVKPLPQHKNMPRHKYLRKCHSDFGSYLGARPNSVKVGVFADVWLDMPGRSWIDDVWVRSKIADDFKSATLLVQCRTKGADAMLEWKLRDPSGSQIEQGRSKAAAGKTDLKIEVEEPELWWPGTHGTPSLYKLEVALTDDGQTLDARWVNVGIRKVQPVLKDPETGENRFRFDINGKAIFLRGACLAPVEGMTHCWTPERAGKLLDLMEHGRMNVMRIWGEGLIGPQKFYDECDRRGILVWQDFMFGYGMHPAGDAAFDANCKAEIEDMILRLRNHPCILLWVGGNENHMGHDFKHGGLPDVGNELFGRFMPEAVARLDPDRMFWPSSPYGGRVPNWPLEGDWHDYSTLKFCPEASVPLYASEVGRVSAPSLSSMKKFIADDDLWPEGFSPVIRKPGQAAWPAMWQYRSVGGSWDKVGKLEQFCEPATAEDLIRVLGTAHGEYLRDRVERERRGVPDGAPDGNRRCWGNTVWRLNDSWPIVYWSVIDYYLEPKIAYYFLRRAYDPVLVSFERTDDNISVWVVNDSAEPVSGALTVRHKRFDGRVLGELKADVELAPAESKRCLSLTDFGPVVLRREYLEAEFAGRIASYLLIGERYLHLAQAKLDAQIVNGRIQISTNSFVRQVELKADGVTGAVFEDNYFDLSAEQKRTIKIIDAAGANKIRIKALNAGEIVLESGS